jgi:hypothetical protein
VERVIRSRRWINRQLKCGVRILSPHDCRGWDQDSDDGRRHHVHEVCVVIVDGGMAFVTIIAIVVVIVHVSVSETSG